jgi:hypothetical protein
MINKILIHLTIIQTTYKVSYYFLYFILPVVVIFFVSRLLFSIQVESHRMFYDFWPPNMNPYCFVSVIFITSNNKALKSKDLILFSILKVSD